ncbi:MAG: hypothetical protein QM765_15115 [Myxococcales bacterium]
MTRFLARSLVAAAILGVSGCSLIIDNETKCSTEKDCQGGAICQDGVCVLSEAPDATVEVPADAGAPDAGPTGLVMVATAPSTTTAGAGLKVTVTAQDPTGATLTTYAGTVELTSSDTEATLPARYVFTASDNGVHEFNVVLRKAGTQTVTATDVSVSAAGRATVTVTGAEAASFTVEGVLSPFTAGTKGSVTVTAKDAFENVATGYLGTLHFTSDDGAAVLPANYLFVAGDNGTHTFTDGVQLFGAGTHSVTATDATASAITGKQTGITVVAAAAASLKVEGIKSPINAGEPSSVTVSAFDPFNNPATSYTGRIHFTSTATTAPLPTLPADYEFQAADRGAKVFPNGVVLRTPGKVNVVATDVAPGSTIAGAQNDIEVQVGPAARLAFVQSPLGAQLNVAMAPVLVAVQDAAGNTVTTSTAAVDVAQAGGPAATLSGTKSKPAVAGVATFDDLKLDVEGTGFTLRATSGTLSPAVSAPFDVNNCALGYTGPTCTDCIPSYHHPTGQMTVCSDGCHDPAPTCNAPPTKTCEGSDSVTYAAVGRCETDTVAPYYKCSYDEASRVDCSATGKILRRRHRQLCGQSLHHQSVYDREARGVLDRPDHAPGVRRGVHAGHRHDPHLHRQGAHPGELHHGRHGLHERSLRRRAHAGARGPAHHRAPRRLEHQPRDGQVVRSDEPDRRLAGPGGPDRPGGHGKQDLRPADAAAGGRGGRPLPGRRLAERCAERRGRQRQRRMARQLHPPRGRRPPQDPGRLDAARRAHLGRHLPALQGRGGEPLVARVREGRQRARLVLVPGDDQRLRLERRQGHAGRNQRRLRQARASHRLVRLAVPRPAGAAGDADPRAGAGLGRRPDQLADHGQRPQPAARRRVRLRHRPGRHRLDHLDGGEPPCRLGPGELRPGRVRVGGHLLDPGDLPLGVPLRAQGRGVRPARRLDLLRRDRHRGHAHHRTVADAVGVPRGLHRHRLHGLRGRLPQPGGPADGLCRRLPQPRPLRDCQGPGVPRQHLGHLRGRDLHDHARRPGLLLLQLPRDSDQLRRHEQVLPRRDRPVRRPVCRQPVPGQAFRLPGRRRDAAALHDDLHPGGRHHPQLQLPAGHDGELHLDRRLLRRGLRCGACAHRRRSSRSRSSSPTRPRGPATRRSGSRSPTSPTTR